MRTRHQGDYAETAWGQVAYAAWRFGVEEFGNGLWNDLASPKLQNSQQRKQQQQRRGEIACAAWSFGGSEFRGGLWNNLTSPKLQTQWEVACMNRADYTGIHSDTTCRIINAAIEVHSELGCGLKEEAYEAALAWELTHRGHKVLRQVPCPVIYKGIKFCQSDEHPKRIDLLVDDEVVVEVKAVCTHHPVFAAQCRTYLRMLNLPVGLVLNFGFPSLKEGIEHVSNPKATTITLPNSKTPNSESNNSNDEERLLALRGVSELRSSGMYCGTMYCGTI